MNSIVAAVNPIDRQDYASLPGGMFSQSTPTPTKQPELLELNRGLLNTLGMEGAWFEMSDAVEILSGQVSNGVNVPIAMAYSGHQFGHWVPLLGDGRAHMLGQMRAADGSLIDVQLKGSGTTQYSRGGDGRATLGAVIREYIVSEAMAGLGIPTTRSLAIIGTGEPVLRETAEPGAVLVRTAQSHIRVGSFQHAAANIGTDAVAALADSVIARNFPHIANQSSPYTALLAEVIDRQANLIAQWMLVGFIHGVMNTDNMSIVGETIDFGPCAFIDEFSTSKVFSSIDRHGRYAWDQQPLIAHWNLTQFAGTLLPIIADDGDQAVELAREQLAKFTPQFNAAFFTGMQHKLGIVEESPELESFIRETLTLMNATEVDFTMFFDRLTAVVAGAKIDQLPEAFAAADGFSAWLAQWQGFAHYTGEKIAMMRQANPIVIARNHRVEETIIAAVSNGDLAPMRRLCRALQTPFAVSDDDKELTIPPLPEQRVTQTFCGT